MEHTEYKHDLHQVEVCVVLLECINLYMQDNVEKSTYQIVTRGKRYIKKSMPLLSPYQKRIVDSSEKISMDDRVICFWVMHNTNVNG